MAWPLAFPLFPAVRVWFVRSKLVYWQTRTDERSYGAGIATLEWFAKQHPLLERPVA